MKTDIVGPPASKKNSALVVWIVLAIIFFDVFAKLLSQGPSFLFVIFFIFFLYIKFGRFFKKQGGSSGRAADTEYSNYGSASRSVMGEDMPPSPSKDFFRGSAVEEEWKQRGENEDSDEYWRDRESKKISSGKMLIDMGSSRREEGGRFK